MLFHICYIIFKIINIKLIQRVLILNNINRFEYFYNE